jgi:hypothetical protein
MGLLKKLEEKFPENIWCLKEVSNYRSIIIKDNEELPFDFIDFNGMYLPGFSKNQLEKMQEENVETLFKNIEEYIKKEKIKSVENV